MGNEKRPLLTKTNGYGIKLLVVGIVLLMFVPPIAMVHNLVGERSRRNSEAAEEVISSWGGRLQISSPMLVLPYYYHVYTEDADGESVKTRIDRDLIIFPTELDLEMTAPVETRFRGIYRVPVYTADIKGTGTFRLADAVKSLPDGAVTEPDKACVGIELSSLKGLRSISPLSWNGTRLDFEPGVLPLEIYSGHIKAPVKIRSMNETAAFAFEYSFNGGGLIEHIPLAQNTILNMSSSWASPSFYGEFLPAARSITDNGFQARWDISYLSRNLPGYFTAGEVDPYRFFDTAFGVRFIEPVSAYTLNERSVKYAWLFLLVPFITLFLFEVLQNTRIHPVQYLLAGAADVVFYLLLLSLSEHISFNGAYLTAAAAVTLLLALYTGQILNRKKNSYSMGLILGAAYLYLFVVLQSEDYALLYGSVGLFITLSAVMFTTRHVKWYGGGEKQRGIKTELSGDPPLI